MNIQRNNEIKLAVAAITISAALVSGAMTVRSANAAPTGKSVKRVVKVKMSGSRRDAINRAKAMQTATQSAPVASAPQAAPPQEEAYGEGVTVRGNVPPATSPAGTVQGNPVNNVQGTPVQPSPQFNNPVGVANVPGVVNSPYGYAAYGPPVVNTGNGFVPLYGTGYNMNGYTIAPYNGAQSPYQGYFGGGIRFGF